jgi:predicted ATPase
MQLPALLSVAEAAALQQKLQGATQTRMLQEMLAAVETLTPQQPLILLIEDLHWSDHSTLDLIASLARGHEPARLLILATYRPGHMLGGSHPLNNVIHELYAHQLANELPLRFLTEPHVTDYLHQRFPDHTFPPDFARALQQRTEGNPLFLTNVLEEWVNQGVLSQNDNVWTLQPHLEAVVSTIPATIRHLIATQSEYLLPEEQHVLEVASLAGLKFSSGAIAAALQTDIMTAEEWCAGLAARQQFLRPAGVSQWPDGMTTERYEFLHALHQQFWHERVHLGRRQQWHLRIGEHQEAAYGDRTSEVASELAVHFEEGRDFRRAVYYHTQAADNAARRYAPQEAVAHLTKGVELLGHQPDTPERMQQELALRTTLGISLQTIRGYGNSVVEQAYTRTRELCQQVREPAQLFRALFGLWQLHHVRAEFTASGALADQLLSLAHRTNDTDLFIEAHGATGVGLFQRGEFAVARTHLERSVALYEPERHHAHTLTYGQNPWVASQGYLAETLWFQGYPDQALRAATLALAATPGLAHPFTQAFALAQILYIYKYHGNVAEVRNHTDTLHAVVRTHAFPFWEPVVEVNAGWALSEQGQLLEGIERIRQSVAIRQRLGTTVRQPYYHAVLAEVYGKTGQSAEGIHLLNDALTIANTSRERNWEAEIYRLKGELVAQSGIWGPASPQAKQKSKACPACASAAGTGEHSRRVKVQKSKIPSNPQSLTLDSPAAGEQEAEGYFLKAIEVSRQQQAKSLELRAAMSLVRLWQQQALAQKAQDKGARARTGAQATRTTQHEARTKLAEAHQMLSEVYNWFIEGFDTTDLQEAKALLTELSHEGIGN